MALVIKHLFRFPVYVFLLPVFFVLHGTAAHFEFIPLAKALTLILIYLLVTVVLIFLFRLVFKSISKAALASFITLYLYFYFGAIHDSLKEIFPGTFLVRYSWILVIYFLIFIVLLFWVKKKTPGGSLVKYLNILFVFLVIFDTGVIIYKSISFKSVSPVIISKTDGVKPDVYLIILDSYSGKEQLSTVFSYDNTAFLDSLRKMGFYVFNNSRSNYASTPFSMASLLNLDYLTLDGNIYNEKNLNYCYRMIYNNQVVKTFSANGYKVFNHSFFDIEDHPAIGKSALLVSGIHLINSETLWARIKRDLLNNFIRSHLKGTSFYRDIVYENKENNELFTDKTGKLAETVSETPRFSYTHLQLPHAPYFYDSSGRLNAEKYLTEDNINDKKLYLGYLEYTNRFIKNFTANIIRKSRKPPIIILLGDHGFRYDGAGNLFFSNLAAVYLPSKNYSAYYETMSNVNQFRILFADLFGANLKMLSDSSVMLDQKKENKEEK